MTVSAIVPNWNGKNLLERLLMTLRAQSHPVDEVLVVDNGSSDGSADAAVRGGARVIRLGRNAGFSGAVNRGVKEARGEWLAILNNDVELAPDWVAKLLGAAGSDATWFVTGRILSARERGRIDGTWDLLCRGGCAWRAGHGCADGARFATGRVIWCAPATAALFRAELFRRVGGLAQEFESHLEDVDFGLRCAAVGCRGRYVPEAVAWHRGSATLGRWHAETVRRIARNQLFLVARHYSGDLALRCLWAMVAAQGLWGVAALRHGAGAAFLRGKIEGLRRFRAVRRESRAMDRNVLEPLLLESERDIRSMQRESGFDWYWRLYFLLTAGGAI
jgi:GT2 family glycosyltransferase